MLNNNLSPFNIDLLYLDNKTLEKLKKITTISIFDNSKNFHSEGLFSTEIFGLIGSENRNRTFAYIDLKVDVFHPLIYLLITKSAAWYDNILSGKEYAIWNDKIKQFEKSNIEEGKTGFTFFMEHFSELKLPSTESIKRDFNISLIEKTIKENKYKMDYMLVLPAGLRDYVLDDSGRPQEDEVNSLYRRLIINTSLIEKSVYKINPSSVDYIRYTIQKLTLDIYLYFKSLLEGKHKLISGKWLTRKTFNSTRNVASSNIEKVTNLNDKNRLKYNETAVGLHQFLRCLVPKSIYDIKSGFLSNVFQQNSNMASLTNSNTLKKEFIELTDIVKDYDTWMSYDGIEKVIANFSNLLLRHEFITVNKGKHYIGLIYKDDKYFKLLQDIDELPEQFNKDNVKPITMTELLYLSIQHNSGKIPAFITRYPVSNFGSIYPSYLKLLTTSESLQLEELDSDWNPSGNIYNNFPIYGKEFFNTVSVHSSHNSRLTLDYDGDTLSVQAVLTDDAIEEINNLLKSKSYYISTDNKFMFSLSNDVLNTTLAYMTR